MEAILDFERPIAELEKKLLDLKGLSASQGVNLSQEISALEKKFHALIKDTFASLTPWQRVLLSRHPNRPYTRDYIENLFPDFMELHGDRSFGEDHAIMAGIAYWPPSKKPTKEPRIPVMILGHQKGRTTKQKVDRNFGMAKPEGYRKAMRLMQLAERARMPILTFVDTPGAYPGIETEERGQAQAIAESIRMMSGLSVPIVSIVIGEGGSGGALALAVADQVFMQEYSTYSVISPEGCASILWSDAKMASRASEVLKFFPSNLKELQVIDGVIPEPVGGAHRDWDQTFKNFTKFLNEHVTPLFEENSKQAKNLSSAIARTSSKKTKVSKKKTPKKTASTKSLPTWKEQQKLIRSRRIEKYRKMGNLALALTEEGKPTK